MEMFLSPSTPYACVTKRNSFSVLQSDMSKHCETPLICLEMIHLPGQMSRCTCSTDLLQLVLKGVVSEMPWRDRISLTLQPGMTSATQTPNITGNISPMRSLRTKKPSLNHWYYKRLRPPLLVGINKRPNWLISILQKWYFSIFPIT